MAIQLPGPLNTPAPEQTARLSYRPVLAPDTYSNANIRAADPNAGQAARDEFGREIAQGVGNIQDKISQNAQIDADNRENQFQASVRDYLHNPDTGIMNTLHGADAKGASQKFQEFLSGARDQALDGVTNPKAQIALNQRLAVLSNAHLQDAQDYENEQKKTFQTGVLGDTINAAADDVTSSPHDDKVFANASNRALQATDQLTAMTLGQNAPPGAYQASRTKTMSSLISARTRPLLESDNPNDVMKGNELYNKAAASSQLTADQNFELLRLQRIAVPKAEAMTALQSGAASLQPDLDINHIIPAVQAAESSARQIDAKTGGPVTSPAGAIGIMQVLPSTAKETAEKHGMLWDENKFQTDANYNTQIGAAYLQDQQAKYGDTRLALAAYNAGPENVDKALKTADPRAGGDYNAFINALPKPSETGPYVNKILNDAQVARGPQLLDTGKAEAMAAKLSTPAAQGFFMQRVAAFNRQQAEAYKGQQNDVVSQIQPILQASNGDMNAVPAAMQAKAAQYGVLDKIQRFKGVTDQNFKLALDTMPTDQFSQVDLTDPQARLHLSAADYDVYAKKQQELADPNKEAMKRQIDTAVSSLFQLPEADPNYDPKTGSGTGYTQNALDAAQNARSSDPDKLALKVQIQKFRGLLDQQIQNQYQQTKKVPSQTDIFKMGDDLLMSKQVTIPTPGIFSRSSQTVNVLTTDIKDINPDVRSYLESGLTAANKPITPANLTLGYRNWLTWLKTNNLTENEGLQHFKGASPNG